MTVPERTEAAVAELVEKLVGMGAEERVCQLAARNVLLDMELEHMRELAWRGWLRVVTLEAQLQTILRRLSRLESTWGGP